MNNAILVGYTGFVGSNLVNMCNFKGKYNSKNIEDAFESNPDLLIYAGVKAEKFLANKEPEKDYEIIKNAFNNIKKINPKHIVLISTIDVYKNPVDVDESTEIDTSNLHPYGYNRYELEKMVSENFENHTIIRLPGLFGKNLKKNFIYDLINIIPTMLNKEKFMQLCDKNNLIKEYYIKQENDFYECKDITQSEKIKLKDYFNNIGFSALNFTDSRGCFQFYNLEYLYQHIDIAIKNNVRLLNLAVEPLTVNEIYEAIMGIKFENEISKIVPNYNYKTKYSEIFDGSNGYIFNKDFVLKEIINFVNEEKIKK
ncbi:sugar nucleotide-binding protein [Clostridium sp. C2-6-12]|uniref:sugar nucleotide-binding protein n=1 Tax=Clostridium sp. C2-6-12 TaxID=2698832 RepID=UPI00136E4189|nr:sugar nucleotide-binding protein [Clostridium sp. C2-6-12]